MTQVKHPRYLNLTFHSSLLESIYMDKITLEKSTLYVVGMPLGNLDDISSRAKQILFSVDLIACEDTRVTALTLSQFGIKQRLISYHEHNRAKREGEILALLEEGLSIAVVSDAGMPAISDPGQVLVERVAAEGHRISVIPGPTAAMTALAASGLDSRRFVFEGFIEVKGKARKQRLAEIAREERTMILYEAPHRLVKTLTDLVEAGLAERQIVAGRELTKRYEEYQRMTLGSLLEYYQHKDARGEFTLVIEGMAAYEARRGYQAETTEVAEILESVESFIEKELASGATVKAITTVLVERYGYKKNTAYNMILTVKDDKPVI